MENIIPGNVDCVTIDDDWNFSNNSELIMHTIHAYPAKFPWFVFIRQLRKDKA